MYLHNKKYVIVYLCCFHRAKPNELQLWETVAMFLICCHTKRSPEKGDMSNGTVFAWSIMFITESDLLCLIVQVDGAHSGASVLGKLRLRLL